MLRSAARTLSFFSKWLAEVVRQPALMASLILGPFALLLAFGQGVKLGGPAPRTMLVVPSPTPAAQPQSQSQSQRDQLQPSQADLEDQLDIVGETSDLKAARERLREGDLDLVAVMPDDPLQTVRAGKRAQITALTNEIDPVRQLYAHAYLKDGVNTLNQRVLERAIGEAQGSIDTLRSLVARGRTYVQTMRAAQGDIQTTRKQIRDLKTVVDPLADTAQQANAAAQGVSIILPGLGRPGDQTERLAQSVTRLKRNVDDLDTRLSAPGGGASLPTPEELDRLDANLTEIDRLAGETQTIPAWVLSAPFELDVQNVAPFVPDYMTFYAPAVLALLLQHLGITLGALSMARIRLIGLMELLRVAPVRPAEVVTGNYLSYGSLCAVAGAALVGLLVFGLGIPVFGSHAAFVGMLALLVLSSLGIGFVISMLASSEQQAAQIAMLLLIGSVFFSGFIVTLDTISWPVRAISYLLPTTYAIRTLQDVMLRGILRTPGDLGVLAGASVVFFFLTVQLFRREYRPR